MLSYAWGNEHVTAVSDTERAKCIIPIKDPTNWTDE